MSLRGSTIHTLSITRDYPALQLFKGDVIVIEAQAEDPIVLYRPLGTDMSGIRRLLEQGAATPLNPEVALTDLETAISWQAADCGAAAPQPGVLGRLTLIP